MQVEPGPYRALIGTIFIFILDRQLVVAVTGRRSPDRASGDRRRLWRDRLLRDNLLRGSDAGLSGYLATFAEPTWVMIPLNIVEQFTRIFSLIVRLFGNVMSGVFIAAIVLSLAGLFVPIPFMALDLLTGAIQAYIFTVLAMVFIGAALAEGRQESPTNPNSK